MQAKKYARLRHEYIEPDYLNRIHQDKRFDAKFVMKFIAKSSHMRDPIDVICQVYQQHEDMCTCLEEIADGLPNRINPDLCAAAVAMIESQIPIHRYFDEECLFPLLLETAAQDEGLAGIMEHSLREHGSDECVATELVEMLHELRAVEYPKNPEMLGYMLRGFFEGFRRHFAWEAVVLIPLAQRSLGDSERRILADLMSQYKFKPN